MLLNINFIGLKWCTLWLGRTYELDLLRACRSLLRVTQLLSAPRVDLSKARQGALYYFIIAVNKLQSTASKNDKWLQVPSKCWRHSKDNKSKSKVFRVVICLVVRTLINHRDLISSLLLREHPWIRTTLVCPVSVGEKMK